jgi:hypothetical protein
MFEDETKKDETSAHIWIGVAIVAVILGGGVYYYLSHLSASQPAPAVESTPAASTKPVQTTADAIKDLKIKRALMDKDATGTMAVWLVAIENRSEVFSYSNIQYETTYYGGDNHTLLVNKGVLRIAIAPGESVNQEIRDALYPTGTARFMFKIKEAASAKQ